MRISGIKFTVHVQCISGCTVYLVYIYNRFTVQLQCISVFTVHLQCVYSVFTVYLLGVRAGEGWLRWGAGSVRLYRGPDDVWD